MFQIQIYITLVFLLSRGDVSAGFENVWRHAELVADIYQQYPHGYIFIINPEAQEHGEDYFDIVCGSCMLLF
jgi:hypothetical protein